MNCVHADTVPVYGYVHPNPPKVGDPVALLNRGRPLAHLCLACDQQLPANWGCPDCCWETYEDRRLCDPEPDITFFCTRRCTTHQEAHP